MTLADIRQHRLLSQRLSATTFSRPEEVLQHMGPMQAQEYAHAKWAIGLRMRKARESDIEQALNEARILRTHLLRPTWHFAAAADLRWLLALTAPGIHARNAYWIKKFGVSPDILDRSMKTLAAELEGGRAHNRTVLKAALERDGIRAEGLQLAYILMSAELDGLICSGPRQGKQFTYALLEERVPPAPALDRQESMMELVKRYFRSRGPATVQDFAYWGGFTIKETQACAQELPEEYLRAKMDGKEYIYTEETPQGAKTHPSTFLMPDYDEYGMSYKDRSALAGAPKPKTESKKDHITFQHSLVIDGRIEGSWTREEKGKTLRISTHPFESLSASREKAVQKAVERYSAFTGKSLEE